MPLRKHTFNLSVWLNRLGFKGGVVPDIPTMVQPVQVCGDASLLVPPLLPPTAGFGRYVAGVAAEYPAIEIQSLSRGGTLIRHFDFSVLQNAWFTWSVRSTGYTFGTAEHVLTAMQIGPHDTVSIVKQGTGVAELDGTLYPVSVKAARTSLVLDDALYIPAGQYFVMTCGTVNFDSHLSLILQDLPAGAGPE